MALSRSTGILILEQENNQQEQEDIEKVIHSKEEGFGFLFEKVRNEYDLSIDDISRELHLDNKVIVALEAEDYDNLPASAFVCGYIRNYARFLNLQPKPLVEYYKKNSEDDTLQTSLDAKKEKKIRNSIHNSSSDTFSSLFITFALLLTVVALATGGWYLWNSITNNSSEKIQPQEELLHDDINDEPDTLLLPELKQSVDILTEKKSLDKGTDKINTPNKLVSINEPLQNNQIEYSQQNHSNDTLQVANNSLDNESLAIEQSLQTDSASEHSTHRIYSAINNSLEGGDGLSTSFKHNQLIMQFSGDSWIKIQDANNKKLSSTLIKAGRVLRLEGTLPYNVFLGDATVVTVSINGVVFDHSLYIKDNNTARFKVE